MATAMYQYVLRQAELLSPDDQRRLAKELAERVDRHERTGKKRSILELRGLGKEIWQGIDAQEYVNQERSEWGGLDNSEEKP